MSVSRRNRRSGDALIDPMRKNFPITELPRGYPASAPSGCRDLGERETESTPPCQMSDSFAR